MIGRKRVQFGTENQLKTGKKLNKKKGEKRAKVRRNGHDHEDDCAFLFHQFKIGGASKSVASAVKLKRILIRKGC